MLLCDCEEIDDNGNNEVEMDSMNSELSIDANIPETDSSGNNDKVNNFDEKR